MAQPIDFRRRHWVLLLFLFHWLPVQASIHHDLRLILYPTEGVIEVQDTIKLPRAAAEVEFLLHHNLKPVALNPGMTLTPGKTIKTGLPVEVQSFRAVLPSPSKQFSVRYRGVVRHALTAMSKDYAGGLDQTPGLISPQGVYLSAASFWFPAIGNEAVTFSIAAELPEGWKLISQGEAVGENGWRELSPQDDIYLVAAPYTLYQRPTQRGKAMAFLRRADPQLAEPYLAATEKYLELYSQLIGPYPYAKFALVENFWETGYGMPSFTLLGPGVIRLPFIIHTSYPHEILHNWWGNGVYVDWNSGNWSEGLTTYLADYLLREQRGEGASYRRTTLQRYADSIATGEDFPLIRFQSRHGQASQSVGYGKSMMFFHMLRRMLGDEGFIEGLRLFYRDNLFKVAGYGELQQAFEQAGGMDLSHEFHQWLSREGAPALKLDEVEVTEKTDGFHLSAKLRQSQAGTPFTLTVPLLVQLEGETQLFRTTYSMSAKQASLEFKFATRPLRLQIDPRFDLFRLLDPSEIPSSLAQLFGASEVLIVLPSDATPEFRQAYEQAAAGWAARHSGVSLVWDDRLKGFPPGKAIWLFGWNNRFRPDFLLAAKDHGLSMTDKEVNIGDQTYSRASHSLAFTAKDPGANDRSLGWVVAHAPEVMPGLARKLPHYRKYSYLLFEGDGPRNVLKKQWPLRESALSITLPGGEGRREIPPPPAPPLVPPDPPVRH